MSHVSIRRAEPADHARLVEFNRAMARETEQIELIADVISAGVAALLRNPAHGFYLVAVSDDQIVGSLMITTEWSDWRNGVFWWIQSVFVEPAHRRRGVYRSLYQFVRQLAERDPQVCGFRLYVEQENVIAQQTYEALGMKQTPYRMFEELAAGINFAE